MTYLNTGERRDAHSCCGSPASTIRPPFLQRLKGTMVCNTQERGGGRRGGWRGEEAREGRRQEVGEAMQERWLERREER